MRTTALLIGAISTALSLSIAPADAAKTVCKTRNELVTILDRKFGETQRFVALQNDRRLLELFASQSGTWTALITMPSGKSCVVGAGKAFTTLPPAPVGEPA